jgi:phage gpG-like protein
MARVRIRGKRSLKRTLRRYVEDVREEVSNEMEAVMREIKDAARRMAPVDTGQLEGSIQLAEEEVDPDDLRGRVGSNVEYAPVQEFGYTGTQQVSGFVRKAHTRELEDGTKVPVKAHKVSAHMRRIDVEGKFFMTKAAQAAKQTYSRRIADAIQRAQ